MQLGQQAEPLLELGERVQLRRPIPDAISYSIDLANVSIPGSLGLTHSAWISGSGESMHSHTLNRPGPVVAGDRASGPRVGRKVPRTEPYLRAKT